MTELRDVIRRVAVSDVTVLVTGESGSGKELVARNLHALSERRTGPFVAVNCAALSPGVLESELFGHGRGSFTGAVQSHAGLFEQADGGTLFLDEISEIAPFVQAKLLRVLQDRQIRRMGAETVRQVDLRIVAATNANLEKRVADASFRMDLFYRLSVVEIRVASLRERIEDMFDFIDHFFTTRGLATPRLADKTRELLMRYRWPGNIRELQNEFERLLAFYPKVSEVQPPMLSDRVTRDPGNGPIDIDVLYQTKLPRAVGYLEENLLRKSLEQNNWNKSRAARQLGLSRQGLLKKIKRYGIDPAPVPEE